MPLDSGLRPTAKGLKNIKEQTRSSLCCIVELVSSRFTSTRMSLFDAVRTLYLSKSLSLHPPYPNVGLSKLFPLFCRCLMKENSYMTHGN